MCVITCVGTVCVYLCVCVNFHIDSQSIHFHIVNLSISMYVCVIVCVCVCVCVTNTHTHIHPLLRRLHSEKLRHFGVQCLHVFFDTRTLPEILKSQKYIYIIYICVRNIHMYVYTHTHKHTLQISFLPGYGPFAAGLKSKQLISF